MVVVVDHHRRRVVWAGERRSARTLHAFFDRLSPDGCTRIAFQTAHLPPSYQQAVRARLPHARVVFDRFHFERLATDPLNAVRRADQRGLAPGAAKALEEVRYPSLEHPPRLKPLEARRLATLRVQNPALDRAYYALNEYPPTILEQAPAAEPPPLLTECVGWATCSRLRPTIPVARTLRKHAAGILGYLHTQTTNGPVEGINHKLRVIARRAYGFHPPAPLISMPSLYCDGIELAPPLPTRV